jgi:hypothetical protein
VGRCEEEKKNMEKRVRREKEAYMSRKAEQVK